MNKKIIKRSLSTLFASMSGLIGTWIYILMFSNRSGAVLVGGIIGSLLVMFTFVVIWCKEIVFEEERFIFDKVIGRRVFNKRAIANTTLINDAYIKFKHNGTANKISLGGLRKQDINYIKEYFEV